MFWQPNNSLNSNQQQVFPNTSESRLPVDQSKFFKNQNAAYNGKNY